jgi:hypothetical protein
MIRAFHGTASIGEILLSRGLDTKFAGQHYGEDEGFLRTVGGIYFTDAIDEATKYACNAISNGAGLDPGVVIAEIPHDQIMADEDALQFFMNQALRRTREERGENKPQGWETRARLFGKRDPVMDCVVEQFLRFEFGTRALPDPALKEDVWTFMSLASRANSDLPWSFERYRALVNRIARQMPSIADPMFQSNFGIMSPTFRVLGNVRLDAPENAPQIVGLVRILTSNNGLDVDGTEVLAGEVDPDTLAIIEDSFFNHVANKFDNEDEVENYWLAP